MIDGEAIVEVLGLVEAAILVREADDAKTLLGLSAATRGSILRPNRRAIANLDGPCRGPAEHNP